MILKEKSSFLFPTLSNPRLFPVMSVTGLCMLWQLPGVGHQMQGVLKEIGVDTVADLRNVTMGRLSSM